MQALQRKLLRDLTGSFGTLISVVAIIAIGAGAFIGMNASHRTLSASQADYYRDYRLADFWVDVKKAPLSAVERVSELPQITVLESRVVFDVLLELEDETRPLTGRLISTPPNAIGDTLNGICLMRGSGFSDDRDNEVIVNEAFAKSHDLQIGDRISLILNRKRESFVIAGTAISPEYVYMVRGRGDLVPDPRRFGVLYVKESYAREVLDFKDSCNQVIGRLAPGHLDDIDFVLKRISSILDPFGVIEVTPRRRQASNRFLSDELTGLGVTSKIIPGIFLSVAALVLNILMVRLAQRQRTTIGTLKALGYSDRRLMVHFLSFGMAVGLAGGIGGVVVGVALTKITIGIYQGLFQFPSLKPQYPVDLLAYAVLISVGFASLGTVRGVREVLRLQPGEAMRQRPPERGGAIFLERVSWLWQSLGFRTHMALRGVFRNRTRTITAVIAMALSTSIMYLALASFDSFMYLVDHHFDLVDRSDVDIGLRDEASISALYEARDLPGVDYAEPVLSERCDLRHGRNGRRINITGLSGGHRLTVPVDRRERPIAIPESGLVLSRKLAELLDVKAGDTVELTPVRGRRLTRSVRVAATAESFLGLDCYADIRYLSEVVGESFAVNALQLSVSPANEQALFARVKELPIAQGLSVRRDAKENIESTLVDTSRVSLGLMIAFAGMIAFGSAVNNALIEIGDRRRELSTLRVLGYRPGEIASILFRQSLFCSAIGMVLAIPIGIAAQWLLSAAYNSELYRMPLVVRANVIVYTLVLAAGFMLLAQWVVHRQIVRLDWLAGVQVKE